MRIHSIIAPCRLCQAAPGEPCKYKGRQIVGFHAKRDQDAAAIARLIATKQRGHASHRKCGGAILFRDEPSDVPGLLVQRCVCVNCGQLTDAQAYPEIQWPGDLA